ncbi:GL21415 [Drosophila persimilis]|uniref:GL21415 n=1 Tax=Drosophila persimilis TaxID=7234 RepID=B4HDI7_DROPE|nr:GL21443 [Drosophila persimilis]EDW30479.1 GL21415 [Drosophila persimilis]
MTELKNMMAQLVTMQKLNAEATAAAATANQQQKISEEVFIYLFIKLTIIC